MACVEPAQIDHRAAAGELSVGLIKRINRKTNLFPSNRAYFRVCPVLDVWTIAAGFIG